MSVLIEQNILLANTDMSKTIYFPLICMANKMLQKYSLFWVAHIALAISPEHVCIRECLRYFY